MRLPPPPPPRTHAIKQVSQLLGERFGLLMLIFYLNVSPMPIEMQYMIGLACPLRRLQHLP